MNRPNLRDTPLRSETRRARRRRSSARPAVSLEPVERRLIMASIVVNTAADSAIAGDSLTTLREAITAANATPALADTITFNLGAGAHTINLMLGELPQISTDMTIQGPGADLLTVRPQPGSVQGIFDIWAGTITLAGLTIRGAVKNGMGGGILNYYGILTINDCIIRDNYCYEAPGGGIWSGGVLTVNNSTISGNRAISGAGIYHGGTGTINNCTISGNSANYRGGGIYCVDEYSSLHVTSSTFHGNTAPYAGAIFGADSITRCTISGNTATDSGPGGVVLGTIRNSIIAGNFAANGTNYDAAAITDAGHNFIGGDPKLAPLADNGGPTQTMALLPGSPCLNVGDNTAAPANDQRGTGFNRIVNGVADIGAFEVQTTKTWIGPSTGGSWSNPANWSPLGVPGPADDVLISGCAVSLAENATVTRLTLTGGGSLTIQPAGDRVLRTSGLSIAAGAALNLTDNDLIYDYTDVSPIGEWNGSGYTGITGLVASDAVFSSLADPLDHTTVALAEASDVLSLAGGQTALWNGQTVDATTVLVKYTYGGDANLDGKINVDDYGQIDFYVGSSGSVFGWFNGDFNLDGKINIDDYGIIDFNVSAERPPLISAVVGSDAVSTATWSALPPRSSASSVDQTTTDRDDVLFSTAEIV